jgi:hypothetical protein
MSAHEAFVSRDSPAVATPIRTVALKTKRFAALESMRGTVSARAEARHEPPLVLDGLDRPVHETDNGNVRAAQ